MSTLKMDPQTVRVFNLITSKEYTRKVNEMRKTAADLQSIAAELMGMHEPGDMIGAPLLYSVYGEAKSVAVVLDGLHESEEAALIALNKRQPGGKDCTEKEGTA